MPRSRANGVAGQKHILLSQRGRKARKIPAMGRIFLLTFPFIELVVRMMVRDENVANSAQGQPSSHELYGDPISAVYDVGRVVHENHL